MCVAAVLVDAPSWQVGVRGGGGESGSEVRISMCEQAGEVRLCCRRI